MGQFNCQIGCNIFSLDLIAQPVFVAEQLQYLYCKPSVKTHPSGSDAAEHPIICHNPITLTVPVLNA
jgi:hypothetical protein